MQKNSTGYKNRPKKRFGQNFLIDMGIADKIIEAADIADTDTVLEIGPGRGVLTERLCGLAGEVIAVEIDRDLAPLLHGDNLTVIQGDILKLELDEILPKDMPVKVVANLPYYITTPILMKLLESSVRIECIVVMVQKEVALRMCAQNTSSDYGALSLAVAFYSKPCIVIEVPASAFRPAPKVDSAVVCLQILNPPLSGRKRDALFSCIKAAFAQRRKTLINALSSAGIIDKLICGQILEEMGFDVNIRGERLSLMDFITLSNRISALKES